MQDKHTNQIIPLVNLPIVPVDLYTNTAQKEVPPKYIRINCKQMNRCYSNLELLGPMVGCLMVCEELGHTCVE